MAEPPGARTRPVRPAPSGRSQVAHYARLSGVLGFVFAGLFVAGLALVDRSPGLTVTDAAYAAFYGEGGRTVLVTVGLYIVPFAGIAFLWHMTTARLLVRELVASPPAIPFGLQVLAGGLFVGLLFCGAAAAGAVALMADIGSGPLPDAQVGRVLTGVGYAMVFVYAVRAGGMYVITTTTLLMSAGMLPRWLGILSYLLAAGMLLTTTFNPAVLLVLPGWVALVGVVLFVRAGRSGVVGLPEAAA